MISLALAEVATLLVVLESRAATSAVTPVTSAEFSPLPLCLGVGVGGVLTTVIPLTLVQLSTPSVIVEFERDRSEYTS